MFKNISIVLIMIALFPVSKNKSLAADVDNAYSFTFKSIDDAPLPLSKYKGKVILVVNTASRCGFTSQYNKMQKLWEKYKDSGLIVLGVPSNNFGNQEPGSEKQIKEFCEVNFQINFPMTSKVDVKGTNAHPFYSWASTKMGIMSVPRWNFHKYLISTEGKLVDWFSSTTSPMSSKVIEAIEQQLPRS